MKIFTRQRTVSLVLTLVILIIGAMSYRMFSAQKESTVDTKRVEREIRKVTTRTFPPQSIRKKIEIDGRVNAFEKINLAAETEGILMSTKRLIKEGTSFTEGELLFKIESDEDEYNIRAQRSSFYNLITQILPDIKFDYPDEYDKWLKYLDEFDVEENIKPLPEITNKKEKYFIGGKDIFSQYYAIKANEDGLNDFSIYAPFSGVFLSVNNYPGSLIKAGGSLGMIMNTSRYEISSPVAIDKLKYVKLRQEVELYSEELDQSWTGYVSRISKQIDQTTQSIPVYISVSGKGLKDGMYLKGTLSGSEIDSASVIPKDLLVNQNEIYLYKDSTVRSKTLEIISVMEDEVVVQGLGSDDQVVTSGTNNLFVGQKVKI